MHSKKPLKAKVALSAKKPIQVAKKPKKQTKPTISKLRKDADTWFSKYIRLRDSYYEDGAWVGECITSGKKILVIDANGKWKHSANLGHFVGRGCMKLRYDDFNCNLQSAYDNAWRDKESMITAYRKALDVKYGDGTARRLVREGKTDTPLKREFLEQVIADSKEYVEWTLAHPQGIQST